MDDNNQNNAIENSDLAKQYQDILDRYSKELANTTAPQEEPKPEFIPTPPPELLAESNPEPITEPIPELKPEPPIELNADLPPEIVVPPVMSVPPTPVFESLEATSTPPKNNIFKYLFFLSLIIFLGVVGAIVYMLFFVKPNVPTTTSPVTPTSSQATPTTTDTSEKFCDVNDKKIKMGDSFPAADGCNTCSCGPDLTIVCTLKACEATPSVNVSPSATKQQPKKQTLPSDLTSFIKFQVIKQSTTPISEKDIVIGDSLLIDNYAQVAANSMVIWAYKKDGSWTYVTSGQESPKCSLLAPLKFPSDFACY